MNKGTKKWVHGLWAGAIGSFASTIDSGLTLMVVAPADFNLNSGLKKTIIITLILGVLSGAKAAFAYLKQAPLPPEVS